MTEAKWLASTEPIRMLNFVRTKASPRKLRLFAVACCRMIWPLLPQDTGRDAIEVAELYADRKAAKKALTPARIAARKAAYQEQGVYWRQRAAHTYLGAVLPDAYEAAREASENGFSAVLNSDDVNVRHAYALYQERQCGLLRDIIGNPHRPRAIAPDLLAWSGGVIPKLAQGVYADRAFDRLPILADALEESGRAHPDLLAHCRGDGPHVRGCWVVDLILAQP